MSGEKTTRQGVRDLDHRVTVDDGTPKARHPALADDEIMEHFEYGHLPAGPMRETSKMFCELACRTHDDLPRGAEWKVALRKLLEAKDAAVRAARRKR